MQTAIITPGKFRQVDMPIHSRGQQRVQVLARPEWLPVGLSWIKYDDDYEIAVVNKELSNFEEKE